MHNLMAQDYFHSYWIVAATLNSFLWQPANIPPEAVAQNGFKTKKWCTVFKCVFNMFL